MGKWVTDPAALEWQKRNFYTKDGSTNWRTAFGLSPEGPIFGFTEANELFIGRTAQLAFFITTIIEGFTGAGPLAQLGLETNFSGFETLTADGALASAAFFAFGALFPTIFQSVGNPSVDYKVA